MSKPQTLNAANTPNLPTDLDILCQRLPGRGAALKRLLGYAGVNQEQLAEAIEVDKSAVSQWISEKKNPSYANLRKCFAHLQIDHNLVVRKLGRLIQADAVNDVLRARLKPEEVKVNLDDLLNVCTETDPDKREELIHKAVMEPVVIAQALKAMAGDTKAAQWIDARQTKIEDKIRLKNPGALQMTQATKDWLDGKNYYKPGWKRPVEDSTTAEASPADTTEDLDEASQN
jgi:transcriptional regulator with XRE-family HTH domain